MRNSARDVTTREGFVSFTGALLLILSIGIAFTVNAGYAIPEHDGSGGPWVNSDVTPACQGETICAEWPDINSNTVTVCCIAYEDRESYDYNACQQFLYRRPLV